MEIENAIRDMRTLAKQNSYDKKLFISIYKKFSTIELPQVEIYSSNQEIDSAFIVLCKEIIKFQNDDFTKLDKMLDSLSKDDFLDFVENFEKNKSLNELLLIAEKSE